VRALAAGVDLLCVGNPEFPDPYDEQPVVEELVAAVVSAVETGVLSRERLEDASARVAALGAWCAQQRDQPNERVDAAVGLHAAARALQVRGEVRVRGAAAVCSVGTTLGFAAGRRESTLVRLLQQRRPQWRFLDRPQAAGSDSDGPLLVLVEGRLDDEGSRLLHGLMDARPDAVVVYGGLPRPDDPGANTVHTFGGGAASARAVVNLILGEGR
jgi:beta-N-acetylhexosaminidase